MSKRKAEENSEIEVKRPRRNDPPSETVLTGILLSISEAMVNQFNSDELAIRREWAEHEKFMALCKILEQKVSNNRVTSVGSSPNVTSTEVIDLTQEPDDAPNMPDNTIKGKTLSPIEGTSPIEETIHSPIEEKPHSSTEERKHSPIEGNTHTAIEGTIHSLIDEATLAEIEEKYSPAPITPIGNLEIFHDPEDERTVDGILDLVYASNILSEEKQNSLLLLRSAFSESKAKLESERLKYYDAMMKMAEEKYYSNNIQFTRDDCSVLAPFFINHYQAQDDYYTKKLNYYREVFGLIEDTFLTATPN